MKNYLLLFLLIFAISNVSLSQVTVVMQPNAAMGHDAMIFNCIPCNYPDMNFGTHPDFGAMAWTNSYNQSDARSLVWFNLWGLPEDITIQSAKLSLYFNPTSWNISGHSNLSGTNETVIRRIIEPWSEMKVTWNNQPATSNMNEVWLAHSQYPNQNYDNIDVTAMVIDMINDPQNSYGFFLRLESESYWRGLIFASSDHPNAQLHPKLEINYINNQLTTIDSLQGTDPIQISLDDNTEHLLDFIRIYPIPATDHLFVECDDLKEVTLMDVNGKIVFVQTIDLNNRIEIDLANYAQGIYILGLTTNQFSYRKKVVIE